MTHAVGERFRSPTVNLIIDDDSFLFFCEHVKEYAGAPVAAPNEEERKSLSTVPFPVGFLRGEDRNLPDIPLFFVHFKTLEEAIEKWEQRYRRINYDNLYVMMDCKMNATEEFLDKFEKLPYERKVIFSHQENLHRWPHNFRFSFYTKEKHGNGVLYRKSYRGLREIQAFEEFDFIAWLNYGVIRRRDDATTRNV